MYKIKERIDYIDVFRGMGILTMVMGHVGFGDLFQHFIHAFHMPMFFFVSGFFYKRNSDIKKVITKKAKSLLIPYFVFGLVHLLIYMILGNGNVQSEIKHLLWENTRGLPIAGALWFLTSLFLTEVIFLLLDKSIKSKKLFYTLIFVLVFVGSIAIKIFTFRLPWGLDASLVGLGFYALGFLVRSKQDIWLIKRTLNLRIVSLVVSVVICLVLIILNGYINMREGKYAILPLTFFNAMLAIVIGINLAKQVANYRESKFLQKIYIWLKGIGKNSIIYLCLNQIVIMMCHWIIQKMKCNFYVGKIVELILVLFSLYILEKIYIKGIDLYYKKVLK